MERRASTPPMAINFGDAAALIRRESSSSSAPRRRAGPRASRTTKGAWRVYAAPVAVGRALQQPAIVHPPEVKRPTFVSSVLFRAGALMALAP